MPQNTKIKKNISKKFIKSKFIKEKISNLSNIIEKCMIFIQKWKTLDIITASQLNLGLSQLENINSLLRNVEFSFKTNKSNKKNYTTIINSLQNINNELASYFKLYGSNSIESLLKVCFNHNYLEENSLVNNPKYHIINKFCRPVSYKSFDNTIKSEHSKKTNKNLVKNKIIEDFMIVDNGKTLDCFDMSRTSTNFFIKVYGIKICFQNNNKCLIVNCILDEAIVQFLSNSFIDNKIQSLIENKPNDAHFNLKDFDKFIASLSIKQFLVYDNNELYYKFSGLFNQNKIIKKKNISQIVKEFITTDLFRQRTILIQLLLKDNDPEFEYLSYLLYDLLSNESNSNIDTLEQTMLFDSLPWETKKFFRDAMKNTIKYTKTLSTFDTNNIPIEQQICLLKANNKIKEKAMLKLKEVKAKSEDTGSKARQYLEGLLKIPFGVFKQEEILNSMKILINDFKKLVIHIHDIDISCNIPIQNNYTNIEVLNYLTYLKNDFISELNNNTISQLINLFINNKRELLISNICFINSVLKSQNIKHKKLCHSGKKINYMKKVIKNTIIKYKGNYSLIESFKKKYTSQIKHNNISNIENKINDIYDNWVSINDNMKNITNTINDSVHGHNNAKRQLERIIGQWITGEQSGYCFGFEGPPGVGKTSLAKKGLAKCLKDNEGVERPFSFIAMGGASNGSTLAGHNYTYVGSTWGKIVDILMESKCMNPIIFIDELDKISNTEHGKEITGILTHLVDATQNTDFQDKYFSGIELNLSKALFIFSYNDVNSIDKILLDRIHRIKFDVLTLHDKIQICNNFLLPEIYEKVNLKNVVKFPDSILKHIIINYTYEAGVRKLKEILFEIVTEINLEILQSVQLEIPHILTEDLIKNKYLKERHEVIHKVIHSEPSVGVINGLWANSLGMGGIIPIECFFQPSNNFLDLKLTGLQGDVMKESMNVAKTLAWKLTKNIRQKKLAKDFEKEKFKGIHIHCPEGAVPKDGPSAGTAITTCIYSLLNNRKIKNQLAITGEINLEGKVSAIGGLDLKILGGIRAGVTTFLFPKQNLKDFNKFMDEQKKYNNDLSNIQFVPVEHIKQVLDIVFI